MSTNDSIVSHLYEGIESVKIFSSGIESVKNVKSACKSPV